MAALLTLEIPPQNFELIRNRIGTIITDEFAGQFALSGDTIFNGEKFVERFVPPQEGELTEPMVNVVYSDTPYNKNTATTSTGSNTYNVDVYARSVSTDTERADVKATFKLHKLLGVIRTIFESSVYLTLGFGPGFIERTTVKSIRIDEPDNNADGGATIMGRVVLEVRAEERTEPGIPVTAEGYTTKVTVNETDKGFLFIQDN